MDHVHLRVSNLKRSLQLYKFILGFKIVRQENNTVFLSLKSSSSSNKKSDMSLVVLSEIKNNNDSKLQYTSRVPGLYHFAILLPERRYLTHFLKHMQKNLDSEYYDGMADHGVSESIYLHDPDLNGIEIYTDRSPSEWKWKDNTIQMITAPLNIQDLLKESLTINNEWNELPANTSLGHIHLRVSNLAKAKNFYHDILELNHTASFPGAYFFASNKYHHHVATNTWFGKNIVHGNDTDNTPGLDHFAINVRNQDNLSLLKDRLLKFKISIHEKQMENDNQFSSSFYAYDFDGIKIQFLYKDN